MNTVTTRNGFSSIVLKLANMRAEQSFTIYPYKGGDEIQIQSGKRIARINLRTGEGAINPKNEQGGAYFHHLAFSAIPCKLPAEALTSLQSLLWHNEGKDGGNAVISWENKELFA